MNKVRNYVKKPLIIQAIEYKSNNLDVITDWVMEGREDEVTLDYISGNTPSGFLISTLEGIMTVCDGDFVIKGIKGEFYPCKPDIFNETYTLCDGFKSEE